MTCLLGAVQGDHVRNWPLPAPSVPRPVLSPAARHDVRGQRSEVGGQAFSTAACMACGSHAQYSASRSAGGGKAVSEWLCVRPQLQGGPSRQPWVASVGPIPSTPQPSAMGHLPGSHSHLGFFLQAASKASRQSALSVTRALSRISVLGCSLWGGGAGYGASRCPQAGRPRPVRELRDGVAPTPGWLCPGGVMSLSLRHMGVLDGQI